MCEDYGLSQNDLRLKLMRKRLPKQIQGGMDLHAKQPTSVQMPLNHHMPQYTSETNGNTILRKIPSRESADDLLLVDSLRNSYSSRNTNGLRGRSPDRTIRTSMRLSPPRNFEELWKVPPLRVANASRAGRLPSSGVVTASQTTGSMPMTMKAPPGTANLVSQYAPGSGSMQHISHMVLFCGCCTITLNCTTLLTFRSMSLLCLSSCTDLGSFSGTPPYCYWFVAYTWSGKICNSFPG